MSQAHIRMKLVLIAPFHAIVLAILALRGYPSGRLALQTVIFLAWSAVFAVQASPGNGGMYSVPGKQRTSVLYANLLLFALAIGNTGGSTSTAPPKASATIRPGPSGRMSRGKWGATAK